MGSFVTSSETMLLGKAFRFIHAVGIVHDHCLSAKDLNLLVDCPCTVAVKENEIDDAVSEAARGYKTKGDGLAVAKVNLGNGGSVFCGGGTKSDSGTPFAKKTPVPPGDGIC